MSAFVICSNVPVKIQALDSPGASQYRLDLAGLTGNTLFMSLPSSSCWENTGVALSYSVFMAIDQMGSPTGIKTLWSSMFLSAEARNKKITFYGNIRGTNSWGYHVVTPYLLVVDP